MRDFKMICPDDHIMIGLSGGKDSLLLSLVLAVLKKRSPTSFSLCACLIDQSDGAMKPELLSNYMASLGIPLIILHHPTYNIIQQRKERSPCSFCANMRRGILANCAREHNCNVVALGHHKDDAVETVLLNLLYGGRFKCFHPHLYMSRTQIRVIRPLIYAEERQIRLETARLNLPVISSCCPYGKTSKRRNTKNIVAALEVEAPEIKSNILHALRNLRDNESWTHDILNG